MEYFLVAAGSCSFDEIIEPSEIFLLIILKNISQAQLLR